MYFLFFDAKYQNFHFSQTTTNKRLLNYMATSATWVVPAELDTSVHMLKVNAMPNSGCRLAQVNKARPCFSLAFSNNSLPGAVPEQNRLHVWPMKIK